MTLAERKRALELARDSWQGVILNNISTCCMEDSMQLLEHSAEQVTTPEVRLSKVFHCPGSQQSGARSNGKRKIYLAAPALLLSRCALRCTLVGDDGRQNMYKPFSAAAKVPESHTSERHTSTLACSSLPPPLPCRLDLQATASVPNEGSSPQMM